MKESKVLQLPDLQTDPGVLSRMLIAESMHPNHSDYDEEDALVGLKAFKAVIANRLSHNPSQFGAPGATTWTDMIVAKGQVKGFSRVGGKVAISDDILANINDVMSRANNGTPGKYYHFVQNVLSVVSNPVDDPFSNICKIGNIEVTGGVYGWRTSGSGSPGPRFVAIPEDEKGIILNNQFFALKK